MDIIKLKAAFTFICPACGCENYITPLTNEDTTPDEREEFFRIMLDLEEWQDLPEGWESQEIAFQPEIVECAKCDKEYATCSQPEEEDYDSW
jgi:hypothetical protein